MTQSKPVLPLGTSEQGVVLVVVLVMLGIFMLIVVSLVGTSNINYRIAGNQQYRMEARMAAQNAVESYISNPANFALPLPNADSMFGVDYTGDGVDDVVAAVSPPQCISAVPIRLNQLNFDSPADTPCFGSGASQLSGYLEDGTASGANSWCSQMNWNVTANVDNPVTGAQITMHQGVGLRAIIGTPCLN